MAPLLRAEVVAREARNIAVVSEDPLDTLAGPEHPRGSDWQISPGLATAGEICEDSASLPAMADFGLPFPSIPFAERGPDVAPPRSTLESSSTNPLKYAKFVEVWNGRASDEIADGPISAETSTPAARSVRIPASETHLYANLSSTAAAWSWALRPSGIALTGPGFASSPAFTGTPEIGFATGIWSPRPGARGTIADGWIASGSDVGRHSALLPHSVEPNLAFVRVNINRSLWSRLDISPTLPGADSAPRPKEAVGTEFSHGPVWKPAVTIRPVDAQRCACRLETADFREIQNAALDRHTIDSMAPPADLKCSGRITIPQAPRGVPALLTCAWTNGSPENFLPAEFEQLPPLTPVWINESDRAVAIRSFSGPRNACCPGTASFDAVPPSAVAWRGFDSIDLSTQLNSTGAIVIPEAQHDIPSWLLRARTSDSGESVRPVESERVPRLATGTNEHSRAVAVQSIGARSNSCHLVTANLREVLPDTLDYPAIDSMAASSERKSTGTIAIPGALHDSSSSLPSAWTSTSWENAPPAESVRASHPQAAQANEQHRPATIRPVGGPRSTGSLGAANFRTNPGSAIDSREIDSLAQHGFHSPVRLAHFRPTSFAGVAAVKFAVPRDLARAIADASVPNLIPARRSETAPASLLMDPRAVQPTIATLAATARIDQSVRPIPAGERVHVVPFLDRPTELPCRTLETGSGKLTAPTIRKGTAWPGVLGSRHDPATEPRITPHPPIRTQPASIFAGPSFPATVGSARMRTLKKTSQAEACATLTPIHTEFLSKTSLVATALPLIPVTSAKATQAPVNVNQLPIIRIPRPAACLTLDLPLQLTPYHRSGKIRL